MSTLILQATDYVSRQVEYEAAGSPIFVEAGQDILIAVPATCDATDGFKCSRTFFFLNETFVGFDTIQNFAGGIQIGSGPPSEIEVTYTTYTKHDQACCPTTTSIVTYSWGGSFLQQSASPPRPFEVIDSAQAAAAQTATVAAFTPTPPPPTSTAIPPGPGPTSTPAPPTPTISPNTVPALSSISSQSSGVSRGGTATLNATITNAATLNAVIWVQPNGQLTTLPLIGVGKTGDRYTLTFSFPADAQLGTWQIVELQVTGGGSTNYTFFSAAHYANFSPCPTFQNLGAGVGCTTSQLESSAKVQVSQ